ncbi:MAG: glycosyltransferase [Hyphomonadaceae bacterium]|nr:glycosyltransferase [Hyphomonadaceae bacterium]
MAGPSFVLSVPIGAWNPALPSAVASLLAQDVDLRLALLDASGDARMAEALAPLQPLTAYHRTGPDAGQAAAIQEGWDAVEGEVYGWLNVDDFLFPDALARVAATFEASPDCAAVTGQSILVTPEFHHLGAHPSVAPPSALLLRSNTISQPSTFVRRDALAEVGWLNTGLHYTMDWDLWVRLHLAGARFASLEAALSGVVMDAGTKTAQFNTRRALEIAGLVRRTEGSLTALKSLIGVWRYHRASRQGEAPAITPAMTGYFYTEHPFETAVRAPFILYDRDITTLTITGTASVRVACDGMELGEAAPDMALPFSWPRGKAGMLELTPLAPETQISQIVFC